MNQLTELPAELGNLTALECLSLGRNQFTELPPELGNLTALETLRLHGNQLSGSIPPELGSLAALELLYLRHNQLTGSIPPELGNLTELVMLELYRNQLTGSLPRTFLQLQGLDVFWFSTNAGLCAPPDDEFQTWLSMIQSVDDPNCAPAVSVEQDGALPVQVSVKGNYPNVFRESTHLRLDLPQPARVGVEIFDVTGRRVYVQAPAKLSAGFDREIPLRELGLPSGAYLYRLTVDAAGNQSLHTGGFVRVRRPSKRQACGTLRAMRKGVKHRGGLPTIYASQNRPNLKKVGLDQFLVTGSCELGLI